MLRINNLRVAVEGKSIVKGVTLKIKPGELHAVMGPNGSGKSTLAYALAGHPHYTVKKSSRASLNHKSILNMTPDERSRAGLFLAFQYPVAIAGVSVQNFLKSAYDSIYPDEKFPTVTKFRQHLQNQAKQLGIPESMLSRSLNEGFSGGEKKRIEILQMAILKPKFAILDETDSGLDIDSIKIIAKGINHTTKQNQTGVLLITHYRRILDHLSPNRVHVMIGGKIVKSGTKSLINRIEKSGYKSLKT